MPDGARAEGRTDDPWEIEAQQPPLAYDDPAPRPENIVNIDEVEQETHGGLVTSPRTRSRRDRTG